MSLKILLVDSGFASAPRSLERTLAGAGFSQVVRVGRRRRPRRGGAPARARPRHLRHGASGPRRAGRRPGAVVQRAAADRHVLGQRRPGLRRGRDRRRRLFVQSFRRLRPRHEGDRRLGGRAISAATPASRPNSPPRPRSSKSGASSSAPRRC